MTTPANNILVEELRRAGASADPVGDAHPKPLTEVLRRAEELKRAFQHEDAIALLTAASGVKIPAAWAASLSRAVALTLGSRVEIILKWIDVLRAAPDDDLLERLEADLAVALSHDADIADLHWDRAVIAARFRGAWAEAEAHLAAAQQRGCEHPMTRALEALISGHRAPRRPSGSAEDRFRGIILLAAERYCRPERVTLGERTISKDRTGPPVTFGDFIADAVQVAREADLDEVRWRDLLSCVERLPSGVAQIIADLTREAAAGAAAPASVVERAERIHLVLLLLQAHAAIEQGERTHESSWFCAAFGTAHRALELATSAGVAADPGLRAELLLARGSALWGLDRWGIGQPWQILNRAPAIAAIEDYRQALHLKRAAGKTEDAERLVRMIWKQIDDQIGNLIMATRSPVGLGQTHAILMAFVDVADELGDPKRALWVRLRLAAEQRRLGRHREAEASLTVILKAAQEPRLLSEVRLELASVLSETGRPAGAAEIQKAMIAEAGERNVPSALWSNYANTLLLLGRLDEAAAMAEEAWARRTPAKVAQEGSPVIDLKAAGIRTIQAQIAQARGNQPEALRYVREAQDFNPLPWGVDGLHQLSLCAPILFENEDGDSALRAMKQADGLLAQLLTRRRPDLRLWHAMLQEWSRLDATSVRWLIGERSDDAAERAMLRAEAAKGRMHAWLENQACPEAGPASFDQGRLGAGLDRLGTWLRGAPGRHFLSLFASDQGLGVFGTSGDGGTRGHWLDEFCYAQFRDDLLLPWERLVRQAMQRGGSDQLLLANALTEHVLDRVGEALVRAAPNLADGGETLAVSPHRLLRNVPIAQVRLPGGDRLSELFETIVIVPYLSMLGDPARDALTGAVTAFGDPDGSLPFARIEALLASGMRALVGNAAVRSALLAALHRPAGPLLLSTHGSFDAENPFRSVLVAADGTLALEELVGNPGAETASVVILGACEAGKSPESSSDEPIGFPEMLLQLGCEQVAAPSWPVDDFASFLFLTTCCAKVSNGVALPQAVTVAARDFRNLDPRAALDRLDAAAARAAEPDLEQWSAESGLNDRTAGLRRWLLGLGNCERPFRRPLDWAAYQIYVRALL